MFAVCLMLVWEGFVWISGWVVGCGRCWFGFDLRIMVVRLVWQVGGVGVLGGCFPCLRVVVMFGLVG